MSGATTPSITYDFDGQVQTELLALCMWDGDALKRTDGLIEPHYFSNPVESKLADMAIEYYRKYKDTPSVSVWVELLKAGLKSGSIRKDIAVDIVPKLKETHDMTVRSRAWLLDHVAEFAKQQAMMNAMFAASKIIIKSTDPDRFDKTEALMKKAFDVALTQEDDDDYDYAERVEERTKFRQDVASGAIPKTGVPTGIPELDSLLHHGGLGRQEMTFIMGGAKSTKSFLVGGIAASAWMLGYNVLYITLENSKQVVTGRLDAMVAHIKIDDQFALAVAMEMGVKTKARGTGGCLKIRSAATGTLTPAKVQRWIDEYKTKGIKFALIVVDYIQLMAPTVRMKDSPIENSKSIAIDMRAIAQIEDAALLSPIQANREGHKSATLSAVNVSEDFNLVRLADTTLAINRTEEEKANGKARLSFIASRNEADGYCLFLKQDLSYGQAVLEVESVE